MTRRAAAFRRSDRPESQPVEIRLVPAREDDPATFERVARAIAKLLATDGGR